MTIYTYKCVPIDEEQQKSFVAELFRKSNYKRNKTYNCLGIA